MKIHHAYPFSICVAMARKVPPWERLTCISTAHQPFL